MSSNEPEVTPTPTDNAPETPAKRTRRKPAAKPAAATVEQTTESKPRRTRKPKAESPEAPVEAAPEVEVKATKPSRSRKPKATETAPIAVIAPEDMVGDALMPTWRPVAKRETAVAEEAKPRGRGRRGKAAEQPRQAVLTMPAEPGEEPEIAQVQFREKTDRKPRERRSRRDEPREAPAAKAPAVVAPPLPEPKPLKPLIHAPEGAPRIVLREGLPTLVRDGRVYPPLFFCGNASDENRAPNVFEEIRLAADAGVHLHMQYVVLEVDIDSVDYAVRLAAFLLKRTVDTDPEAQVVFRLVFTPPKDWAKRFPNAAYRQADGVTGEPSICDDEFWGEARRCLELFVKRLAMVEWKQNLLGIHLDRGEWFNPARHGYDTSEAAIRGFRDWARTRYGNDVVALRAAWFDGGVDFDNLRIPPFEPAREMSEKFVRARRRERRWVDYHLFLSDATVERIADLAYATKSASEGNFLVGVNYGYTFEWSHPHSAHLSLGKLLRTPEVDFIAGPPSYASREPGQAAPFPGPIDSLALNGKLYISEEDFKTSIGAGNDPDDFNPVIKTPQALDSLHWRGAGVALSHGAGLCWTDTWGNGWLKTKSIWDRSAKIASSLIRRMGAQPAEPDVAVFIDERALAYLVDEKGFERLVQNVRESVLRSGLSSAFYLLSDLQHRERFPESKLYIFLNAWDVRPELRMAIKNRLQRDGKVLFWLYGAGLFDSGRESLERAREVTGIAIKPQPFHSKAGTTLLNRRHPLSQAFADLNSIGGAHLEPSYFAIPEDALVLGEYSATGLPSFVVREFRYDHDHALNWKSVFLGEPFVTPALVRALGQMAGAHVWNFQEDVVHVRTPFLTVHTSGAGPRTIMLPNKWSAYDIVSGEWQPDGSSLKFQAGEGVTYNFLVGPKEEIEAILAANPDDLLKMDVLPETASDTVRFDLATFDVPIMRLDEWMDFGEGDDLGDDLIFKPRLIEDLPDPEPEADVVGRRRRKRRTRGGEESSDRREEGVSRQLESVGEFDMNVVFRKRE